jgi:hypothetical protein
MHLYTQQSMIDDKYFNYAYDDADSLIYHHPCYLFQTN